eukprot:TRINITY_DN66308_c0_g1_i1.p1 TRINITY_DN66308_c0_g1~~TRINITY_DN66308_c0_g1_i1.p1  ORF type:complete len:134 (+),score=11.21 TRINITY_DN66308_c0_g1_i1:75-476(+)
MTSGMTATDRFGGVMAATPLSPEAEACKLNAALDDAIRGMESQGLLSSKAVAGVRRITKDCLRQECKTWPSVRINGKVVGYRIVQSAWHLHIDDASLVYSHYSGRGSGNKHKEVNRRLKEGGLKLIGSEASIR